MVEVEAERLAQVLRSNKIASELGLQVKQKMYPTLGRLVEEVLARDQRWQARCHQVDSQASSLVEQLQAKERDITELKRALATQDVEHKFLREMRRLEQTAHHSQSELLKAETALRTLKERSTLEKTELRTQLRDAKGGDFAARSQVQAERHLLRETQLVDQVFHLKQHVQRLQGANARKLPGGVTAGKPADWEESAIQEEPRPGSTPSKRPVQRGTGAGHAVGHATGRVAGRQTTASLKRIEAGRKRRAAADKPLPTDEIDDISEDEIEAIRSAIEDGVPTTPAQSAHPQEEGEPPSRLDWQVPQDLPTQTPPREIRHVDAVRTLTGRGARM
jgi:hypothetical protein